MGAKTWMLVYADGEARKRIASKPALDRAATEKTAAELFPGEKLEFLADGNLAWTSPPNNEIHIGCFAGLTIVAAREFGIDHPSKLPQRFISHAGERTLYLHAMHSVVDWFAFAVWRGGKLQRSLSLSPDGGILEDIGTRLTFETPYWSGQHPAVDAADADAGDPPYPLPFHPLDLGDAALRELFGYQLEGYIDGTLLDPEAIALLRCKRKRSLFRFW